MERSSWLQNFILYSSLNYVVICAWVSLQVDLVQIFLIFMDMLVIHIDRLELWTGTNHNMKYSDYVLSCDIAGEHPISDARQSNAYQLILISAAGSIPVHPHISTRVVEYDLLTCIFSGSRTYCS